MERALPGPASAQPADVLGSLEAACFEAHPDAQFVFDSQVVLVAANRAARELVERANGPRAMAEALVSGASAEARRASDAIREAIRARVPSEPIALRLAPPLAATLRVVPLAPVFASALVTLTPLEEPRERTPGERFGFTPTERRVASLLCRGIGPAQIARELDISVETVRCHLKKAFAKAGVHRQAELVAALLGH